MLIGRQLRDSELLLCPSVVRVQADPRLKRRLPLRAHTMTSIIRGAGYPETGARLTRAGRVDLFFGFEEMLVCRQGLWVTRELSGCRHRLAGSCWKNRWI